MRDHQLTGTEAQLHVALDSMPGALAYTDEELNFVFCNDRFKDMYRVPSELLQPGRPYADLLRHLASNGYYGEGEVEALVAQRVESLRTPSDKSFEDHTPDGRWYRVRRRRVAAGGTVTVITDVTEQKQVEREPSEALRQQTAAGEILRAILNSPSDIESVLGAVAENAARLCDVADAEIMRVESDVVRLVAKHGPAQLWAVGDVRPINRTWVTGRAIVDRTTVHVPDLQAAEDEFPQGAAYAKQYGHRTTLATPLLREGVPIGAILIRRKEVRPITEKQIALLRIFADQAAIAIENVRLFNEIRDKSRQVEEQAAQLAEWNRTLETRVAEQVTQLGRMSKLTRFLSPKISDLIMSGDADDSLKTRRSEITVVYVDLRGFTGFTETAEPEEVMHVLRQYHAELGRIIMAHDGTIEHFAGDGMMVLFNAPMPIENHEMQAIRMALAMRDALGALSLSRRKRGHELGFGAGIAGGYATIGTIGFEQRLDYGAVGPACNLAARLCGEAQDKQILIAPRVLAKAEEHVEVEPVGELLLKGFHRPIPAHNVLRIRPPQPGAAASGSTLLQQSE